MILKKKKMVRIINKSVTYNLEDKVFLKFRKKSMYLRNKINFELKIKNKRRKDAFYIWNNIPYSFLIFASSLKNFHQMKNNLYLLNEGIVIRKQRFFYKKAYHLKTYTSFYTYRLYMKDLYYFFSLLDLILDYDMIIVGLELHDKIYTIEQLLELFTELKTELTFFLKSYNYDFNYLYQGYFNYLNIQCQLLTN